MNILLDYTKEELMGVLSPLTTEKFRIQQLIDMILSGKDYDDKTNLPASFLESLKDYQYILQPIKIRKAITSKGKDKTTKFLYDLPDGNIIEGVLMNYAFGSTLCVSTQVGCKMNCAFCASGLSGFVRNLSVGEILGQIVSVNRYLNGSRKERKITNIVLMGSGEPLDNFANVTKFLKILTSEESFDFSVRNISLSTCGIPSKIIELADMGLPITLCFSMHSSNDFSRREIMPIARRYSLHEVIDALKYFYTMTNRRIIIEYTLIEGVNNALRNAKEVSEIVGDLPCHVNVIKLNEVEGRDLKATSSEDCKKFVDYLNRFGVSATLRRTLGDDIDGACGQLRNKELMGDKVVNKESLIPIKKKSTKTKDARALLKKEKSVNSFKNNTSKHKERSFDGKDKSFEGKDRKFVTRNNTSKLSENKNLKSNNKAFKGSNDKGDFKSFKKDGVAKKFKQNNFKRGR